jgi:hypothetical protein
MKPMCWISHHIYVQPSGQVTSFRRFRPMSLTRAVSKVPLGRQSMVVDA